MSERVAVTFDMSDQSAWAYGWRGAMCTCALQCGTPHDEGRFMCVWQPRGRCGQIGFSIHRAPGPRALWISYYSEYAHAVRKCEMCA